MIAAGCVTSNPVHARPRRSGPPAADAGARPTARPYVVRPNDTLSRIARRFGLTVGQLLTANPEIIDPNLLRVGQELLIPPPGAPDTSPSSGGIPEAETTSSTPTMTRPRVRATRTSMAWASASTGARCGWSWA